MTPTMASNRRPAAYAARRVQKETSGCYQPTLWLRANGQPDAHGHSCPKAAFTGLGGY